MEEQTVTAAAVITFCGLLEDGAAALYEEVARRYALYTEQATVFAAECRKSKLLVLRTYQETITDAIEAGYAFDGLRLGDPLFGVALDDAASAAEALAQTSALEAAAAAFYVDIAERSQDLLATIPGAFRRAGRTHAQRLQRLQALPR